jgi:hypothetical protein
VVYLFGGFLPPLLGGTVPTFQQRDTIPVKFTLRAANGAPIANAQAGLSVFRTADQQHMPVNANPGVNRNAFRFDLETSEYIYNLQTGDYAPGTYTLLNIVKHC